MDQTYDATSSNPQSGTAVAEAVATKEDEFDAGDGLEFTTDSDGNRVLQVEGPVDVVAGPGIVIDNPDGNTLRISVAQDVETVLYYNSDGVVVNGTNVISLNESLQNFEFIKIIDQSFTTPGGNRCLTVIPVLSSTRTIATNDSWSDTGYQPTADASKYIGACFYLANDAGTQITMNGSYITNMAGNGEWLHRNQGKLYKITGVHRIANN